MILPETDRLAERLRQSADERRLLRLGFALVAFGGRRLAQTRLGVLEEPARREPAEFFEELRPEELRRVGKAHAGAVQLRLIGKPLRDDQAGFFRRAALAQQDGARLLDAVDVGLRDEAAHLSVEIFEARDDDDGVGQAVGDLNEIAHGALKAIFGIVEEAQILDLIDAEDERGAIDRPHQRAERRDDFEGAIFAVVRIERRDGLMRDRRQLAAVQVLADTLVDARIAALQIKQGAHDIDVEFARLEFVAGDDLVGEAQDEPRQLFVIERRVAEFVEIGRAR